MKKDPDQNSTDSAEIEALITRLERGQLRDEDAQLLTRLLRLLLRLITLLQQKNASLSRLKRLLFGPRSDKRRGTSPSSGAGSEGESDSASSTSTENPSSDTPKGARSQSHSRKGGHGRMGAEAYTGARVVRCRDTELKPGTGCPHDGCRGKLYDTKHPAILIRLTGQPLVGATRARY
jgi:transposase